MSEIELKEDTWSFPCYYPDHPVMPLSLLLESMTQAFPATFLSKFEDKETPVISSIGNVRLKESAVPGDRLRLKADLFSFRRGIAKGIRKAYKNNGDVPIQGIEIVEALP